MRYFMSDSDPVVQTASGRVYLAQTYNGDWEEVNPRLLARPSTAPFERDQIVERLSPSGVEAMDALE